MKIVDHGGTGGLNRPDEVLRTRSDVKQGRGTRQDTAVGADKVSVSDEARILSRLQGDVGDTSGVRTEKVEELRGRIEQGEYQVDLKAVARKFLESIFRGRLE